MAHWCLIGPPSSPSSSLSSWWWWRRWRRWGGEDHPPGRGFLPKSPPKPPPPSGGRGSHHRHHAACSGGLSLVHATPCRDAPCSTRPAAGGQTLAHGDDERHRHRQRSSTPRSSSASSCPPSLCHVLQLLSYVFAVVVAVLVLDELLPVPAAAARRPGGGQLAERVVNPGERISIPCFLETPGGSIQWVRNGHPVVLDSTTASRRQWIISKDGTANLQISQVTRADDGLWECWEFADDGSVKRIAKVLKLVVTGAPEEPFLVQDGKRVHPGNNVVAKENHTVTVECVARRAVPEVKQLFWFLGPDSVNVTANSELKVDFVAHEDSYTTKSTLRLNVTRVMNNHRISCHVFHVAWPNASVVSASLNVLYPPTFSISRVPGFGQPIVEKSFVSLECIIDANPPSTPRWLKDDQAINSSATIRQGGGFLNFTAIERNQSGWYRCTTQHPMGSFNSFGYLLSVHFGPEMMDDTPKQIHADFGEPVRLECHAKGKPLPSYCWSRRHPGGRIVEGLTSDASLVLDPVVYQDAGTYQCSATNQLDWKRQRNALREVQLSITGRPDVSALNASMVGVLGHSLWITVHVCANPQPTRSHWLLGRYLLSPGDDAKAHPHYIAHPYRTADTPFCRYASLEIPAVRYADMGEFLFVARNERGIDDAVVNITVVKSAFGYQGNLIHTQHNSRTLPGSVRSEMSRPVMANTASAASGESLQTVQSNMTTTTLLLAFTMQWLFLRTTALA